MKFIDGNWMLQPGVRAHHPAEAHDVDRADDDALVVHAPTRRIAHRGDTLQGPLLTITVRSPMADVIAVRIEHYAGGHAPGPHIPLQDVPRPDVKIDIDEATAVLRSGKLSAIVPRQGDWELSFRDGDRLITRSGFRGMGYVVRDDGRAFIHEQLELGVGECVYGLGERFTAFVKNGQVVENWNKDGGTGSDQAYKSVPFYLTNRGYGVLVNHTGSVSFEVASEKVSQVQFSIEGEALEYLIFRGPTPKDVLGRLTALTGRPALPPAWSFGLWLTTSFTTSYDEATVNRFIDGMQQRKLPLHVFHFDCFWMREFDWCSFEWDRRVFPDPRGMLERLHARGLKVCVWINPYIGQRSPLFAEGKARGFLLKKPNGDVWQTDQWQPGMAIVDFTNPDARTWYAGHLRRLLEMGVDAFKTDFGERIPTEVAYFDGSDPVRMHNHYAILYNETVFSLLEEVRGRNEAVLFARSTHASGQRFPLHWGGDSKSTFASMAESLRGGLSLGLCGFGFWSHDIGGFEGLPPLTVYQRWVAFGLLSSHSRLHGSSSYRVPWNYDEAACDVLRHFTEWKCRLMPYLFQESLAARDAGVPVMRAMMLEFPGDPACDSLDRQYMLGGKLLVAPVFSEDGTVDFFLPEGRWTHLFSGEVHTGPRWHRAHYDLLSLGVFVRPGTVLPIGASDQRPDYDFAAGITFRVYELDDGKSARAAVPALDGTPAIAVTVRRDGQQIQVSLEGAPPAAWHVQLMGVAAVEKITSATTKDDPAGVLITPDARAMDVACQLPGPTSA